MILFFVSGLDRPIRAPIAHVRGDESGDEPSESRSPFVTKAALFERWNGIVRSVEGELSSAAEKMAVRNPDSALEAALWIR